MTKQELLEKLDTIKHLNENNTEMAHIYADEALLDFIEDIEISKAYKAIKKWYA